MIEYVRKLDEYAQIWIDFGNGISYKADWGKMGPDLSLLEEVIEEIKVDLARAGYDPAPLRSAGIGRTGRILGEYWEDYMNDAVPLSTYIAARMVEKTEEDDSNRNRQ